MAHNRWLIRVLFVGVVLLSVEATSAICLAILRGSAGFKYEFIADLYPQPDLQYFIMEKLEREDTDTGHVHMDSELGWALRPGGKGDEKEQLGMYTVDAQGFRETPNSTGSTRILAVGDSFTFGYEVTNAQAWPSMLETVLPETEVLNAGVPGYGTDQALLLSRRLIPQVQPQVVLLGFQPENTNRNVNVLRAFYTNEQYLPYTKPRFKLVNGTLQLVPNPVQTLATYKEVYENPRQWFPILGAEDFYYSRHLADWRMLDWSPTIRLVRMAWLHLVHDAPHITVDNLYSVQSEAVQVTMAIVDAWYKEVEEAGAIPVVVVLPDHFTVAQNQATNTLKHEAYLQHWNNAHMRVLDTTSIMSNDARGIPGLFGFGGHYSPEGNAVVANAIANYLKEWNFVR